MSEAQDYIWLAGVRERVFAAGHKVADDLRIAADEIDREAARGDAPHLAERVVHIVTWALANADIGRVASAYADLVQVEQALRTEKENSTS